MLNALLRGIGAALDGIDVALCAFDRNDCALSWNQTFLGFFPEHAGHIRIGEPYADNLRRFYALRLDAEGMQHIERYVEEGVERHRQQRRPYEFDHHGIRVRVSSVELGGFGRVRVWRKIKDAAPGPVAPVGAARPPFNPDASLILDRIADGVLVVDSGDFGLWANRAFLALYGLASVDEAHGLRFEEIYRRAWGSQADSPECERFVVSLRDKQSFSGAPYEVMLPGDRWVRVVEQRGDGGDGADGRGYFVHVDITTLKRQQASLQETQRLARESEERYRLLAEFSSDVTVAVSAGVVSYVSPAVQAQFGWHPEQLLGRPLAHFCHPDDVASVTAALATLRHAADADYRARAVCADGHHVWVEARARLTTPREAGEAAIVVINIRNIAARKATEDELARALERLEAMAATDGLTGVSNRRRFDEALALEHRRALRDQLPLTLLLVDLDWFKYVNDTYGHQVGDDVLRAVSAALAGVTRRAGEIVARYGGEEFALLLPNTAPECALAMAERVHAAVRGLRAADLGIAEAHAVTVSVGIACSLHLPEGAMPSDLVLAADKALFGAKHAGRNRSMTAW